MCLTSTGLEVLVCLIPHTRNSHCHSAIINTLSAQCHHKHDLLLTYLDSVPAGICPTANIPQQKQSFCGGSSVNISINCSEYNVSDSPTPKQKSCHALEASDWYITDMQIQTKHFNFFPHTGITLTNQLQLNNLW